MRLNQGTNIILLLILFCLCAAVGMAGNDIDQFRSCGYCGMDRKAYGYSRMTITYEDGSRAGVCSLHCAVTEIDGKKSAVKSLMVADRTTHEMVEAEKAFWVMGGRKRGVMTPNPKWAFATKDAAHAFMNTNGGVLSPWDTVRDAARKETAHR